MSGKLLTEQRLEFLSLKGGCTGSSESTLVKIPYCWKSHATAQLCYCSLCLLYDAELHHGSQRICAIRYRVMRGFKRSWILLNGKIYSEKQLKDIKILFTI